METIPLSHIFYTQRLKVPGINNFFTYKIFKIASLFPYPDCITQTPEIACIHTNNYISLLRLICKIIICLYYSKIQYIFNQFFPIFLTDKLHPVIFYSMIIGNTVHFIHLAYPTNIVTDIRNYNHFNPKELNPILKLAICEDNPSHYEYILFCKSILRELLK